MTAEEMNQKTEKIRAGVEELTALVSQACAELRDATDSLTKSMRAGEI